MAVVLCRRDTALAGLRLHRTDEYESVRRRDEAEHRAPASSTRTPSTRPLETYATGPPVGKDAGRSEKRTGEEIQGKVENGTHAGTGILEITGVADRRPRQEGDSVRSPGTS